MFREGDIMFINTKNINRTRSNMKLDHRNIRFYKVEKVLAPLIYKLELLILMRI